MRNAYKILLESLEGRNHSEDRRRREYNIKKDLKNGCDVDWIGLKCLMI
jgi:hypothetical protein